MAQAWLASPLRAHNLRGKDATPPPVLTTAAARAQYGLPYVHSALVHARSLLARQVRLLSANSLFVFIRIFSAFFMAVIFGGLYWQGGVEDGLNKYGLFLNCVMQLLFCNISEMSEWLGEVEKAQEQSPLPLPLLNSLITNLTHTPPPSPHPPLLQAAPWRANT